jgi:hypothetical protein
LSDSSFLPRLEDVEGVDGNPGDVTESVDNSRNGEVTQISSSKPTYTSDTKIGRMSLKHAGPLNRAQKRQNEKELAILKSLAAAVASAPYDELGVTKKVCDDEDADGAFGRYVVTELKSMSDGRAKLILKNEITNAIFNAKIKSMQEPPF